MAVSGKRAQSNEVAKERLKLVLIHDRAGTSPNTNMLQLMRRDIMRVISNYIDISEDEVEIEITRETGSDDTVATKLVANIPIKNIKSIGRNA